MLGCECCGSFIQFVLSCALGCGHSVPQENLFKMGGHLPSS